MMRTALLLLCAASVALAGCAKVGTLDRPAPLFGEKAKAKYRADQATAAKAAPADNQPEALPSNTASPDLPPVAPQ
jgi:uncharacterized protein YceK